MNEHGAMQEFVAGEVQHDWNHDEIPRLCMLQASFQATKNADIKIDFSLGLLACHACLLLLACLLACTTYSNQTKKIVAARARAALASSSRFSKIRKSKYK